MLRQRFTLTLVLSVIFFLILFPSFLNGETSTPPTSEKSTVTDVYHDVSVTENYRWLEDYSKPVVKEWTEQQNLYTRSILDTVTNRELIKERLTELLEHVSPSYKEFNEEGDYIFALKMLPPAQHYYLVRYSSLEDASTEKIIVNVDEIDKEHLTEIEYYTPSPDGKLVAVSLSEKGSESGDLFIFDSETGEKLDEFVPKVNEATAGGDVAWKKDGSGFYYTRYPHKGERPDKDLRFYQQVYYHQLGTSYNDDRYITGEQFPRIAEIELEMSDDFSLMIITVANGDGGEFEHFLMDENENITQITQLDDLIQVVHFGKDNSLYFLSHKTATLAEILHLPPGKTDLDEASVFIEESDVCIKSFYPSNTKLYIRDLAGGPTRLRVVDLKTGDQIIIPSDPISSVGYIVTLDNDDLLFRSTSYLTPSAYFIYHHESNSISSTPFVSTAPADFSDFEVYREFATSKDGTKIPVNIIHKKGIAHDGSNPTILTGYGGYRISLSPWFDAKLHLWLEQGGVYVIANLRGGGEYGKDWHLAGNLTNKQNVFDDFTASAEHLFKCGYTTPEKLIIKGKSNGGLLMGAAFTQHPEYYKAVVAEVGIYDMLRVELDANGEFNITEFGTVKNPEHFKALYTYSPYHNVNTNTNYPSVLFTAAVFDGRVDPMQSRKMTALLQNETITDNPILLRTSTKSGHSKGSLSQKVELETDIYTFIFSQLDMIYKYDK
jgi:prolyl oligopeptidase